MKVRRMTKKKEVEFQQYELSCKGIGMTYEVEQSIGGSLGVRD